MTRDDVVEWINEILSPDEVEELLLSDGFEGAFMGILRRFTADPIAVYDEGKCIEILVERDGMDYEGAREFFEFNVVGAWVGDRTPAYLIRKPEEP